MLCFVSYHLSFFQEDTTAPTSTPPGAIYYNSFETGSFGPEWSVTTSDNEDSTGDSRGRSLEEEEPLTPPSYWTLTTEEAFTGVYSIKSPDLSNDDFTRRSANVTLTSDIPEAGYLTFSILSRIKYPADDLIWYVDWRAVRRHGLLCGWWSLMACWLSRLPRCAWVAVLLSGVAWHAMVWMWQVPAWRNLVWCAVQWHDYVVV